MHKTQYNIYAYTQAEKYIVSISNNAHESELIIFDTERLEIVLRKDLSGLSFVENRNLYKILYSDGRILIKIPSLFKSSFISFTFDKILANSENITIFDFQDIAGLGNLFLVNDAMICNNLHDAVYFLNLAQQNPINNVEEIDLDAVSFHMAYGNGKLVFTSSSDGEINILDIKTRNTQKVILDGCSNIYFANNKFVVESKNNNTYFILDSVTGKILGSIALD